MTGCQETQLSLLGVSSLPDNHEVTSMRQRTPEIINHGPGGQDKVGQCLSLQDNTSMRRQLQTSFSNMEDFEAEFRVIQINHYCSKILIN